MKTMKEFAWNVNYYYNNPTNSKCIGSFFAMDVMTFPEKSAMSKTKMNLLRSIAEEIDDRKAMIMFLTEFVSTK